jgi:hypothetical protein
MREWYAKYSPSWARSNSARTLNRQEKDIFPFLGAKPSTKLQRRNSLPRYGGLKHGEPLIRRTEPCRMQPHFPLCYRHRPGRARHRRRSARGIAASQKHEFCQH